MSTKGRWNTPSLEHNDKTARNTPSIQEYSNKAQIDDYLDNGIVINPEIKPTPIKQRPHLDATTTQKSFAMVSSIAHVQSCKK